ncbi:MAG: hypothetical protein IPL00_19065 [Gammaproteobacteria bacterium]|nr:hypothetical protein [Gammaproteobacteria bacterium]
MFDPDTLTGAALLGIIFLLAATMIVRTRSDVPRGACGITSVGCDRRASPALGQVFAYLIAFVLYAHLVPGLRALCRAAARGCERCFRGTSGLAAQNTPGNLVSGLSPVLTGRSRSATVSR